jgi:hypothetical protein
MKNPFVLKSRVRDSAKSRLFFRLAVRGDLEALKEHFAKEDANPSLRLDVNYAVHGKNEGDVCTPLIACVLAARDPDTKPDELATRAAIVRLLVSRGADVNKADTDGMTPLHHLAFACVDGGRFSAVLTEALLDCGADRFAKATALPGATPSAMASLAAGDAAPEDPINPRMRQEVAEEFRDFVINWQPKPKVHKTP